ncbi:MAG TPA: hypothetical protein VGU25_11105 [Acidobacteriaceae bacterium]|nr:hypothetical protein [Acidobacteriaceae bacterium]
MITVEQFAGLFRHEEDLREKLSLMLRNVPGYQGVRITHGNMERGKDVIFYASDPLTGYYCCACVVKSDRIVGSVSSNQGARTVFLQAQQCLDTSRTADDGTSEYARMVYIVSPYECSESAMASIQGSLEQRRGSIQFLCGSRLLEMFEKYYLNGLIFDSSFLGNYVIQLRSALLKSDPISFIAAQNDIFATGLKQFEAVYVKQDFRKTFRLYDFVGEIEPPFSPNLPLTFEEFKLLPDWLEYIKVRLADEQI